MSHKWNLWAFSIPTPSHLRFACSKSTARPEAGCGGTETPLLTSPLFSTLGFALPSPQRSCWGVPRARPRCEGSPSCPERGAGPAGLAGSPPHASIAGDQSASQPRGHPTWPHPPELLLLAHEPIVSSRSVERRRAAPSPPGRKSISFTVINYPAIAAGAAIPRGRGSALTRLPTWE